MEKLSEEFKGLQQVDTEAKSFAKGIVETVREPVLVLSEDLEVIVANENFYKTTSLRQEETEGESIYNIGNKQWGISELRNLLETTLSEKRCFRDYKFNCDFKNIGKRSFLINGSLLRWKPDKEKLILLSFKDVTRQVYTNEEEKDYLKTFRTILAQAPAMICTLSGPEHIFEIANEKYFQLVGNRNIIGKPVREALPEVENQGFFEILDQVYKTGEPFIGTEHPVKLDIGEKELKNSYLDFVYQPIRDTFGNVNGIFVHAIDVTEQVLARKKIEESECYLRKLIDTVPAIIWITDKDGNSTYLNKNWYEYTGQSIEDAEGFGWLNSIHPEDRENAEKAFRRANHNQEPYSLTYRLHSRRGGYRWVIDRGRLKYGVEGEYEGMIGTVIDVHEEKTNEYVIREKEHRIRTIVEEATVATALYSGRDLKIELANEAMIKLWGKDSTVLGKSLREALPELEGQPFFGLLEEVYSTGKIYWGEEERVDLFIDDKLQTGYYNFTYKPLRDENGNIYGILNMAVDVTEMVKSRTLLEESESHFRKMADLMPGKVSNTDAEGNFLFFNQNWLDYTGTTSEELKEKGWTRFIHPDEREEFEKLWEKSLGSGRNFEKEIRILNKYGKYKWHLSRAEAVIDEKGRNQMWIGANTEIQKIKEEEKRKGDFLRMVSHELKTPVTSIKGYIQLLLTLLNSQKDIPLSSLPLKPSLERMDHQIVRLTRLISEMLDLSRIEENQLELQKETFNINDLVEETVQDINYTNTQHKIKIAQKVKADVYADRDRIGQVLINFITNAIKYSPESQDIDVTIWKDKENKVSVSVRDRGIGIDIKNHKNIFKRFYRIGGKGEETYSGFGIGLYLANEIIQRHKGHISLASKKGEGSEFSFRLSVVGKS